MFERGVEAGTVEQGGILLVVTAELTLGERSLAGVRVLFESNDLVQQPYGAVVLVEEEMPLLSVASVSRVL